MVTHVGRSVFLDVRHAPIETGGTQASTNSYLSTCAHQHKKQQPVWYDDQTTSKGNYYRIDHPLGPLPPALATL